MNEASNKRFTSSSVFHQIVNSDMPASEKTEDRLTKEAQVILTAGTITTSRVLAVAWYHVASNPDLRCRLEVEVENVMADWPQRTPAWAELEKLLLLQGIVKESLR
jgi:cytochrome P450